MNGCGDIANFQFAIRRASAILNFGNKQISTFRTVYSHNVHVLAKFRRDRMNGCGDIANFQFPIWWPVRHTEFRKYANFNISHVLQPQSACSGKILLQSVER